jgi:hypothetical protein
MARLPAFLVKIAGVFYFDGKWCWYVLYCKLFGVFLKQFDSSL